ncbi:protein FAM151A [Xenopus laevis]|uniref:Protein FAM151A n=2 Tax=Xenopus laevis TaxID=8355 RepID=A0A1L8GG13_XENLA|nr:protein FAM151A [Xenopus laevis]OCT82764.1 hypothetical protein XELAEV_18025298mg [Xenopus laevis]
MKGCSVANIRTVAGIGVFLGVCIAIVALCVTLGRPHSKDPSPSFSTGDDMLEYLMYQGEIRSKDGLLVSWYHAANSKSEMEEALNSDIMILEADVNVEGHLTLNETNLPIMAHPPAVYSDNTLQNWLDSVLKSPKGIKLDFKSIQAVGPSLDILFAKASEVKINRPVWLNADILKGPNVNHEIGVDATQFLNLVKNKFPDVTLSPGWVTLYLPPIISNRTYTREMIQQMYNMVRDLPQKITYPARAVMTRSAWPHFNWLLQQSERYTITLWQGKSDPLTLEDLLFIRDSSNPEEIYYDIFEPLLSEFKEAALNPNRKRLFYPGGSIQLYFQPEDSDGLLVNWYEADADILSEKEFFSSNSGMITLNIRVKDSSSSPQVAFPKSPTQFSLEDYMNVILANPNPWGVFLKIETQDALNKTLKVLSRMHDHKALNVPVWISMEVSYGNFSMEGYIQGIDFLNTINDIFPYVTIAPSWPAPVLGSGYTEILVQDMLMLCEGLWQEVSFQLNAVALGKEWLSAVKLLQVSPMYSLTIEHNSKQGIFLDGYAGLMAMRSHEENRIYYRLQQDYLNMFLENVFTS